jgi:hypothetical protein
MAGAMVYGYRQVYGKDPPRNESWIYPLAVSSLETAHWTAMYNWNAGNITSPNCGISDWYYNPGVTVNLKFISFRDAGTGSQCEIHWLAGNNPSKTNVQQYADDGDLAGFQSAMSTSGYGGGTYPSLAGLVSTLSSVKPSNYTPPFIVLSKLQWAGVGVGAGCWAAWLAMELYGVPRWAPRWVKAIT